MDLFIAPDTEFEKVAAETTLPEDPNVWPHEVLQELYKQVPYIADFSPHVTMERVDGERGYGFGHVEVMNQTEVQAGEDPAAMAAAGIRQVRIPVIIKDGKLQCFDVMVTDDSRVLPLTETRLRTAIFRPQAFDVTGKTPGDQSMIGQLYPPYRQNYGFGGGGVAMNAGMGKESSALEEYLVGQEKTADSLDDYAAASVKHGRLGKRAEIKEAEVGALDAFIAKHASADMTLLQAILPTLNVADHERFIEFVSDRGNQALLHKNAAAVVPSVQKLLEAEPTAVHKFASAMPSFISPTVVQVVRGDSGYKVKTASHLYWEPREELLDRGSVVKRFGEKVALAADLSGAATLAEGADASEEEDVDAVQAGPITESGLYRVHAEDGTELIGAVVTNLIDIDGTELPLALFSNGSQTAVQTDIRGTPADVQGAALPTSNQPSGSGFFFSSEGEGVKATIPLTLQGSFSGAEESEPATFQAETFDGNPVQVSVQPNIQTVVGAEGKMLVPAHWQWSPLGGESVALQSEEQVAPPQAPAAPPEGGEAPEAATEGAEEGKQASVQVRSSGAGTFSIRGPSVSKLAYAQREFLGIDDAMFLLAGLGVEQGYGAEKLAYAMKGEAPISVRVGRSITTAEDRKLAAMHAAEEKLGSFPNLRHYLWKEAATLSDPMAVDTVLSLGFINPENLMTFVGYLPTIEESQLRMCELLLAARLGQSEIPQGALEKAIRSTEEVLEGLKALAFQTN